MTDNSNEIWHEVKVIGLDGRPTTKRVKDIDGFRRLVERQQKNTNLLDELKKFNEELISLIESTQK